MYTNELYHYGILGMKWGVRRYQNPDGSYKNGAEGRYDPESNGAKSSSKSSNSDAKKAERDARQHKNVEKMYLDRGFTKAESREMADKYIRGAKILAACAVGTAAAVGGYAIIKHVRENQDFTLSSKDIVQRIEMDDDGTLHDVFYGVANDHDKQRYYGQLGAARRAQGFNPVKKEIAIANDIKVAGKKTSQEVFNDLLEHDSSFRKGVTKAAKEYGMMFGDPNKLSNKQLYTIFNRSVIISDHDQKYTKAYFDALNRKGYGALLDLNDAEYSGYEAHSPVIFFNQGSNVKVTNVEKMPVNKIQSVVAKDTGKLIVEQMLNKKSIPIALAVSAGSRYAKMMKNTDEVDDKKKGN